MTPAPVWTPPGQLQDSAGWVAAALILINIRRENSSSSTWDLFSGNLVPMVDTLLASSPGTNIHFIVITDEWTLKGEYNYVNPNSNDN